MNVVEEILAVGSGETRCDHVALKCVTTKNTGLCCPLVDKRTAPKGIWTAIAWRMVLYPSAIYCGVLLTIFFLQSSILFQSNLPTRDIIATPKSIGLEYESVRLRTEDGLNLDAWFIPAQKPRGTVLFFHGNGGNISHRLETIKIVHRLGLSTFIFDYRGFGQSEGEPSETGTYRDAEAAWRYLTEHRGIAKNKIALFGRSLGGAIAAYTASRHQAGALILESPFTSLPDIAGDVYWFLPARWLVLMNYDTKKALKSVDSPVLVIHSVDDELVPYSHGRTLFEAARSPKHFLELRGGHAGGFRQSEPLYEKGIGEFLTTYFGG
jgi:uncharacterized protein